MQYDKGRKPRFGLTSLAGVLIAYVGIGSVSYTHLTLPTN